MSTRIGVAEFLEQVSKLKNREEKVAALKHNKSFVICTVLQGAFDPRVKFLVPEGTPPYSPSTLVDQQNVFIKECRKLEYLANPKIKQPKREQILIELLEMVDPADARLIIAMKDKKLPWSGITKDVVREAFPELIP